MNQTKLSRRLRIRTILLIVNSILLILPLGSIYFLKIYEDELVHQTESELVAQGAVVVSAYAQAVSELRSTTDFQKPRFRNYGLRVKISPEGYYQRVPPKLEFSKETIAPPFPDARPADSSSDQLALMAGKRITPILKKTKETTLAGIRITDFRGIVIATSGIEYGLSLKPAKEIRQALKGQPVSLLRKRVTDTRAYSWTSTSRDTGLRVFVALPVIQQHRIIGTVLLSRTPRSIKKALFEIKGRIFGAVVLLLVLMSLLTLFTSLTISKPVNSLIKQTRAIASGRHRLPVRSFNPMTREFELLALAFDDMAEQLEIRSEYIRNFALNVSHEFKTPLTSIQGALELFQNYLDNMTEEKRQRFLNNMQEDTLRLRKLVNRLLEMAKADVFQPGDESTQLMAYLVQIKERYRERDLRLILTGSSQEIEVGIAPEVFDTVISNLLDNSLQHGATTVTIYLSIEKLIKLQIRDNGNGISATNAKHVFTPFFTTIRKTGGTGLGLSIIRTLLQTHGGDIEHIPTSAGARFDMVLIPQNIEE